MKKLLITALALCLLCGCAKNSEVPVNQSEPEVPSPAVTQPETVPDEKPVEMETEIVEPSPDENEIPSDDVPLEWQILEVDGLIEDTVAFGMEKPIFSGVDGAEVINSFYEALLAQLENHTRETVYPAVLDKHTGANVNGILDAISYSHQWVEVTYTYAVEYLDGSEPESFTRTDRFDLTTGELLEEE